MSGVYLFNSFDPFDLFDLFDPFNSRITSYREVVKHDCDTEIINQGVAQCHMCSIEYFLIFNFLC